MSITISSPFRKQGVRIAGSLLHPDALVAATAALLLPLAMLTVGLSGPMRLFYPALAMAAAAYLYLRNSPWYVGLVIWLFCASPLIRRMVDLDQGFQNSSPVLLAPYVACLFASYSVLRYMLRYRAPFLGGFVAILTCVGYGMFLAAIGGRVASGAVDVLKWGVGPMMAVHVLSRADQRDAFHRALSNSLVLACPLMAAYGIQQFLEPAPWDVDWVSNMILQGMTSMGQPLPMELRVFGTMHSPGSFGIFLMAGTILMIGRPLPVALPALGLTLIGLALAQYRAIWAGTAIGILLVLMGGVARERARILVGGLVLVMALGPLITVPEMQERIAKRFDSLSSLSSDESGEDRLNQYRAFLESDAPLAIGEGLAISGASRQMDGQQAAVIDSGIIEVFTALGIFGGTVFFGAIGLMVLRLFMPGVSPPPPNLHLYRAVVVATFLQFPFGSIHVGESGFPAWVCLGLALASLVPRGAAPPGAAPISTLRRYS